jgi:hypothetical protein
METTVLTKKEDEVLYGLLELGQITLEEFLEFSRFEFAPKLMEAVRKRKNNPCSRPNYETNLGKQMTS